MIAYERNTDTKHPLARGIEQLDNLDKGQAHVPLVDFEENTGWYCEVSIGTPPQSFNGIVFLSALQNSRSEYSHIQSSSILEVATSGYPPLTVTKVAKDITSTTHILAAALGISRSNSK
jgi:hypothetical protein